jgi:hypothetical protein
VHADATAGGDENLSVVQGICEVGQAGVGPERGRVDLGGAFHGERFVGPLGVEFLDEGVEAGLLLEAVHAGRSGGLPLQREVHAFVTAVLLGMAGLDAFDGDAEPEPPDGEFGEVEESVGAGEGDAIVGPDGSWEAAFLEELLEGGDGEVLAGRFEGFAEQEVA